MLERLKSTDTRARIRRDIERDGFNNWGRLPSWDSVRISVTPNLPQHAGRSFAELATERSQDPLDCLCDYVIAAKGATRVLVTAISEDDVTELMRSR